MVTRRGNGRGRGTRDRIDGRERLTPLEEAFLKEAGRKVDIVLNGRSESVRMDELVTRKMMQMAVNGGQHSISNAVHQINMAQQLHQQKIDERVAFGHKFKTLQQDLLRDALKRGLDVDSVLPHPDDIAVEEGVGYQITGPIDQAELRAVKRDCAKRDAAILQAALEERIGALPCVPGKPPSKHPASASALLVMHILNNALPKRFQKTDMQIVMELMQYRGVSKRELLKRTHRAWASLGSPKPRGWRLPPVESVVSTLDRVVPAMVTLYPDVKRDNLSVETIAIRLQRMIGPVPIW
ncbi:hypothetical protein [Pararhizobium sp.]|uniref:hypothetical protein n=1 Tax=Pararhizobium sp. TaxID=1977563 RepID=UPI0027203560|nr:hypothetical protein [Pararhizobium sp.]MDO9415540.1 hypothetical protein [Pararhizobium sp.]